MLAHNFDGAAKSFGQDIFIHLLCILNPKSSKRFGIILRKNKVNSQKCVLSENFILVHTIAYCNILNCSGYGMMMQSRPDE